MDRVLSKLGREEPVGVAMSGMRRPLTDVSRGLAIVDILNGAKPGKKIAWRAEMDALLNDFPMRLISSLLLKAYSMAVGMIYITLLDLGIAESWQNTKSH